MMIGKAFTLLTTIASRCGLGLLVCLCASVPGWGTPPADRTGATLHIESALLSNHALAQSRHDLPARLPFLDMQMYQTDVLALSAVVDRGDPHACGEAPCQERRSTVWPLGIGIDRAAPGGEDGQSTPAPRYTELFEKSVYVGAVDAGIMLLMKQLPTSVTKWSADKSTAATPLTQWQQHVTTAPVIDKDLPLMNASHAYSGSGYYTLCRNTPGFTGPEMQPKLECLGYAALMSTFWEYGPEAFAEIPSIQDLLVTPLGGAILGELFYLLQQQLAAQGGEIFGSPLLGKAALVLLHPLEEVTRALRTVAGPLVEQWDIHLAVGYSNSVPEGPHHSWGPARASETTLQLQLTGKWPGGKHPRPRKSQ